MPTTLSDIPAPLAEAHRLAAAGDHATANTLCEQIATQAPNNTASLCALGETQAAVKQWAAATALRSL